ncbi:MAG: MBL fold metallo-hydrolase [Thermofilaceae archaeon]
MLRVRILGGGRRVGKTAMLLEVDGTRVLLDYGVDISGPEPEFPQHVRPADLDMVVITHAHLDHSGAAPILYISVRPKLYATRTTLDLSEILIGDFMKLSKYYVPYETPQVETMVRSATLVEPGAEVEEKGVLIRFWNAGHVPGSLMVEIEAGGRKLLYTGDFNTVDTCLLKGASLRVFEDADIVVMEGTYAAFDHPNRDAVEKAFVRDLLEVLDSGGSVLIPTFAVGRAQEILCVLAKHKVRYPVYIDGMARRVNTVLLENLDQLRDPALFKSAVQKAIHVNGWEDRRRALEKTSVIISPAAMLKGGASVHYAKEMLEDPRSAVFFVSYIMRDTPARKLLEEGVLQLETFQKRIAARMEWYDFSSHCGKRELLSAVERMKPDASLVLVHSEEKIGLKFIDYVTRQLGVQTYFPNEGETLEFK